jgi:predicted amidohydrolase
MTNQLNIAMVQLNQRVGDLAGNAAAMLDWRAKAVDADLVVFPEQQLIGYPAEDLVLKPTFAARAAARTRGALACAAPRTDDQRRVDAWRRRCTALAYAARMVQARPEPEAAAQPPHAASSR